MTGRAPELRTEALGRPKAQTQMEAQCSMPRRVPEQTSTPETVDGEEVDRIAFSELPFFLELPHWIRRLDRDGVAEARLQLLQSEILKR